MFTVNYDRCFEEAAARLRFVVVDGFSHTVPQIYDASKFLYDIVRRDSSGEMLDYIANVFHFYKLHGSLDWTRDHGEIVKREKATNPLLIYPRASKYEQAFEPPFPDMMSAFQGCLRQPDTALIVIGFKFDDDHIARPIMSAPQSNLPFRLLVCDPFFRCTRSDVGKRTEDIDVPANRYHVQLARLIDSGDPRIGLLQSTFEDAIRYIPDLVAESDRERHAQRFRELRELEARLSTVA